MTQKEVKKKVKALRIDGMDPKVRENAAIFLISLERKLQTKFERAMEKELGADDLANEESRAAFKCRRLAKAIQDLDDEFLPQDDIESLSEYLCQETRTK